MSSGVVIAPEGCEQAFEKMCLAQATRGVVIRHQVNGWWVGLQGEAGLAYSKHWLVVLHGRLWFLDGEHAGANGAQGLLAAWMRSGSDVLCKASGNFAFFAQEQRTGQILLYQSLTGSCGLFRNTCGPLLVASEARAVAAALQSENAESDESIARFDLEVLCRHLLDQLTVDDSFIAGVRRVPCDTLLTFDRSQRFVGATPSVAIRKIAELASKQPSLAGPAAVDAIDQGLRKVLSAYPQCGMLALSAGWDSRNLALRLDSSQRSCWSAVTLALGNAPDEFPVASDLARCVNLPAVRLAVPADRLIADYLQMIQQLEAPVHVQSLGNWRLAEFAGSAAVRTLMFGDGGDELFLFAPDQWQHARRHPLQATLALAQWLSRLSTFSRRPRHSLRRMLQGLVSTRSTAFRQTGLLASHLRFPWIGLFESLYARRGVHLAYPYLDPLLVMLSARLGPFARLYRGHPKGLMVALLNCAGTSLGPCQADPRPVCLPYRMVDGLRDVLARPARKPTGELEQALTLLQQTASTRGGDLGVSARLSCTIALLRAEC